MKKALFFVCFMLFSTTMSYAQVEYLTEEEKTVTEKDLDDAFVAPSSKFIGKKWYVTKNKFWIFNANGTIKFEETIIDTDYGDTIHIKEVTPGRWKRNKQYLDVTLFAKQVTYTPVPSDLKKYSLRKQEQIKQDYANVQKNERDKYNNDAQTVKRELRKVTNDYIIWSNIDSKDFYLFSQKMLNELKKREQEAKAERKAKRDEAKEEKADEEIAFDGPILDTVEEMPEFPGGPTSIFEYLSENTNYPEEAKKNGIEGRVLVTFVVEPNGSTSNVKAIKSVDPLLDLEAVRLVKSMPRWTPGKQNGKVVRVKYTVPVTFKLP